MLDFVGDDGLTDLERRASEQRWEDTVARRPTLTELQRLQQRLAEYAGERMCRRCGHAERAHERYSMSSSHCAWCGSDVCKAFRAPRPRWWPRWARWPGRR